MEASMTFDQQLNEYISILKCTAKDLALESDIAPATISRYINGKRVPFADSNELDKLSHGISSIAAKKDIASLSDAETIYASLSETISTSKDIKISIQNFNQLTDALNVNLNKLSKAVNYDASYIYKIKTGQRKPANTDIFLENVCQFIMAEYSDSEALSNISKLLKCDIAEISNSTSYYENLYNWLSQEPDNNQDDSSINNFLENLDSFNFDEYVRTIHFDTLKVPSVPFNMIHSKTYYELDGMKEAELDFYKGTVLSKSTDPIFMFSDMPMEDMAEDLDFGKKWMFAIALSIKKGLHLNVIHNLDRPFSELMLGLQSWIPLYMTGQISPYYFKNPTSDVFHQLTYVSGVCALDGQCIEDHHSSGKYTLYSSKKDVAYYKERSHHMLEKASSLMDIYMVKESDKVKKFLTNNTSKKGNYKTKFASLPPYTLSSDLLKRILKRVNMEDKYDALWAEVQWQNNITKEILSHSPINVEVSNISKEEFEKYPPYYSFDLCDKSYSIEYTYEEYLEHMELTEAYANDNENYMFIKDNNAPFRNIQIRIKENSWAIISKRTSPTIHFVIHHPKLVSAIWNFIPIED